MIIQNFDLNLIPNSAPVVVHVDQYDHGTGRLRISLYEGDVPYEPSGTAQIQGSKPDGRGFLYNATLSGNVVTANLEEQMTAVAGKVMAQVVVTETSGRTGSFKFVLDVQKSALPDDTDMSESDYQAIEELIEEAQEVAQEVEEDKTAAEAAASAAEDSAEDAEAWAKGTRNGTAVPPADPTYQQNSRYWAEQAEQYAQGGLKFINTIYFASLPTSGMRAGDMYNIKDAFTTDSRFEEGAGIRYPEGTNVAWTPNNKWDALTGNIRVLVSITLAQFNALAPAQQNDPTIWWWVSDADNGTMGGSVSSVTAYPELTDKPSINGVEINGVMTSSTLHLAGEINTGTVNFKQYGNEYAALDFPENSSATIGEGAERFNDYRQRTGTTGDGTLAIGRHSHAEGNCTLAYGDKSHAEGENCVAGGTTSHAEGNNTYGKGNNSHAEGNNTLASGQASHAEGNSTVASGNASHSEGLSTTASGDGAHAEGSNTVASGTVSHAEGGFLTSLGSASASKATNYAAHAEGTSTTASGDSSHSEGIGTVAQGATQHVCGHWNVASDGSVYGTNGDAFIIGNGEEATKSNAFRVTFAGAVYGKSAYNSSGADYAEFFEWVDGNKKAEDRVGYFVTLEGNKIKIANPGDYVLGVVSGHPSVIGNGDEEWTKRWERDEFGRILQERKEDKERNETITCWVQNPKYDVNKVYIERKDRIEWDTIAMLGVVEVRDDGTCKVNGYCDVSNGGIATKTDKGYRIISRVTDNVIKIIFR